MPAGVTTEAHATPPPPETAAGVRAISVLRPRTTYLSSEQIQNRWSERIKAQSLFSARTTQKSYLDMVRENLAAVAARGVIPLVAERKLQAALSNLGYTPEAGFPQDRHRWGGDRIPPATPGSITDLSSSRRIQLILDTNVKQARSLGQIASSDDPVFLMANPAWHLTRMGARKKPRGDWKRRWKAAGEACGWVGAAKTAMVALKTSPIWEHLGRGAGDFRDAVGSPYPPFAFGSGLAWVNVRRSAWKRMCEKEGIPDGLDGIREKARQLKRLQEAEGGVGAYGASAVRRPQPGDGSLAHLSAHEGRPSAGPTKWEMEHGVSHPAQTATVVPPPPPRFSADTSTRDAAVSAARDANAVATSIVEVVNSIRQAVDNYEESAARELARWPDVDAGSEMDGFRLARERLAAIESEARDIASRAASHESAANGRAIPADAAQQAAYDAQMRMIASACAKISRRAQDAENEARGERLVAERLTRMVSAKVDAWKAAECDRILVSAYGDLNGSSDAQLHAIQREVADAKKAHADLFKGEVA